MNFILNWLLFYISIVFTLCVDNLCWISASPEYLAFKQLPLFKKENKILIVEGKTYKSKISYIFKYRVLSVIKHWRDILPAVITSFILTIIWR